MINKGTHVAVVVDGYAMAEGYVADVLGNGYVVDVGGVGFTLPTEEVEVVGVSMIKSLPESWEPEVL